MTSVRDFMVVADPLFFTTPKTMQQLILTFAVKTPPFTFVHRLSPPRKKQLMENRGPGRPKKKLREEDCRQKWYDAVESEGYSSIGVRESYEAAIINHHTADENSSAHSYEKNLTQRKQWREGSNGCNEAELCVVRLPWHVHTLGACRSVK